MWVPIYKKDDKTDKRNYRPITVLNSINKVFEQQLTRQISEYMDDHLNIHMSAYRANYSCETTLLKLVEDWKSALDNKAVVGILSTDTSKAFDCLLPPLMLNNLKAYNFSEKALKLVRSYFENRQGRVKLKDAISFWREIKKVRMSAGILFWPSTLEYFSERHVLYREQVPTVNVCL